MGQLRHNAYGDFIQQVHQSNMTGKLIGFKAISTNTLTNEYCQDMHKKGKDIIIISVIDSGLGIKKKN